MTYKSIIDLYLHKQMNCFLSKIQELSGPKATIYTISLDNGTDTLFNRFLEENSKDAESEIINIVERIRVIGNETGAKFHFFKHKEGELGDGICALYDIPKKNIRLYCARYSTGTIIIGGGGPKAKNIKAFQEDSKLKNENYFLREVIKHLTEKMRDGEIKLIEKDTNMEFEGEFKLEIPNSNITEYFEN